MSLPRFYCPSLQVGAGILPEREAHHARHVLRLRPGQEVELLDGQGALATARIAGVDRRDVRLEVDAPRHLPRPVPALTLFVGLLKPRAFEWLVQKATELGVHRLVPLLSEHVALKGNALRGRPEKWHWIAADALKQSGHAWLPDLSAPESLDGCLDPRPGFDWSLLASVQAPLPLLSHLKSLPRSLPRSVALWVGPEGDFSTAEEERIRAAGASGVSLGPRVLRAETAALCGLALVQGHVASLPGGAPA